MIFIRVFYKFFNVLKLTLEIFYRDNLAVHLYTYVLHIMFMSIYVFEWSIIIKALLLYQQNYVLERCQKISNHNSLKKATLRLDRYIVYLST